MHYFGGIYLPVIVQREQCHGAYVADGQESTYPVKPM